MNVRKAAIEDLPAIHRLSKELGYDYSEDKMRSRLDRIIEHPDHEVLVSVKRKGTVTGYIHLQRYDLLYCDSMMNILGIVVDRNEKGKGIGSELLRAAENVAFQNGCVAVRANSGHRRTSAHKFYESNGFEERTMQRKFIKKIETQ